MFEEILQPLAEKLENIFLGKTSGFGIKQLPFKFRVC